MQERSSESHLVNYLVEVALLDHRFLYRKTSFSCSENKIGLQTDAQSQHAYALGVAVGVDDVEHGLQ